MAEVPRQILVIGGGGREHALAWAVARSPGVERVLVAPGNGGTAREPGVENVPLAPHDAEGLVGLALARGIDLTIVGPEAPLAAGIVDRFRAAGLSVFGPTAAAARIETSKHWARDFMRRHGIPHPAFTVTDNLGEAERAVRALAGPCVIKADGLASGKGVVVCDGVDEGLDAVRTMLVERAFGTAGERVLVEERLEGPELSVMAVCDGRAHVLLLPAQDHKRLRDGDEGPNTGGMGSYAPAPIATPELLAEVEGRVIAPTLAGMAEEGVPFVGCLYAGLMLTGDGPRVIEFNARFGDPETQVQLPLVSSNVAALLAAAARGAVADAPLAHDPTGAAVCVVLAAQGYPAAQRIGAAIEGLEAAERRAGVKVFHAGTALEGDVLVTTGGRALNVTCVRDGLASALAGVYGAIGDAGVHFEGMVYRTDIAFRAVATRGAP